MWAAPGDGLGLKTLWTDGPDAKDRLAALYKSRRIRKSDHDDLEHFIDHGWLVWRGAIEPELIDAFAADIRGHHHHPGKFVTTNHRQNKSSAKLSGDTPDRFESLFDLYVNLESSRAVCFHPRLARFLTLVFDTKPVACQQLLFQRSNGHRVHQDTSVVAVEEPLLLAASWIALEDVVEGSGELAFYDRSHKLPHYLFSDGTKRISEADDEKEYNRNLKQACERAGLEYGRFLAKKGDVFLWAADLVHLSHTRTLPDDTSRLSCVTHYHPATTTPFWFRFHPDKRAIVPYDDRGFYASAHYVLPRTTEAMIEPVLSKPA